jgi:hypothetical protein
MNFWKILIGVVVLACCRPAAAQVAASPQAASQDWAFVEAGDQNAVIAVTGFDNGIILSSRCANGVFDVTVNGLPAARGFSRPLRLSVGDEPLQDETWTVADNRTAAFSRLPASLTRRLAKGGRLQIAVPAGNGERATRYVMELPPSPANLERTLTSCGRPLVDRRDVDTDRDAPDGLSSGVAWVRMPRIDLPDSVRGRYVTQASVTVSCVASEAGGLTDCIIESEHPGGYNFGREVRRALRQASIRAQPGGPPLAGRLISFTAVFRNE